MAARSSGNSDSYGCRDGTAKVSWAKSSWRYHNVRTISPRTDDNRRWRLDWAGLYSPQVDPRDAALRTIGRPPRHVAPPASRPTVKVGRWLSDGAAGGHPADGDRADFAHHQCMGSRPEPVRPGS